MAWRKKITCDGKEFPSYQAACNYYKINYGTLLRRLRRGLSPEFALKVETYNRIIAEDHLGKKYRSIRAMCRAYGIRDTLFRTRLSKGWSLKKCLSPDKQFMKESYDHEGRHFKSIKDMAVYWGQDAGRVRYRLGAGWLVKDALTVPPKGLRNGVGTEDERKEDRKRFYFAQREWEHTK